MGSFITTYTGKHFDPTQPDAALIDIDDIAHALPMICRGNGHVKKFWSVGEHCILCAKEAAERGLSARIILASLLHDASECYMSDVPRPFKKTLGAYIEAEDRLLDLIYTKYLGSVLDEEEEKQLKAIDDDLLWFDLTVLLSDQPDGQKPAVHCEPDYRFRSFADVEAEYKQLFQKYTRVLKGECL